MLRISKTLSRFRDLYVLSTKDKFFQGNIIMTKFADRIEFTKPTQCYNGNTIYFSKLGVCQVMKELPLGVFNIETYNEIKIINLE